MDEIKKATEELSSEMSKIGEEIQKMRKHKQSQKKEKKKMMERYTTRKLNENCRLATIFIHNSNALNERLNP